MAQNTESGGKRPPAALDARDLTIRLLLAERAVAEQATRIGELTAALARLAGVAQPSAADDEMVVDADAVSPLALGFYHREFDKLGRPFRWTGKSDLFEFRLDLNRGTPWSFEVELQANPNVDMTKLRGFADYIEIPVAVDETDKTVSGIIPERTFGMHATLSFLLPNTYVPSTINPAVQDNRTLGLIFYELRATTMEAGSADGRDEAPTDEAQSDGVALKSRRRAARDSAKQTQT